MKRRIAVLVLLVVACTSTSHYTVRPAPSGVVRGVVTDAGGGPLPGVTVTIGGNGRPDRTTVTDADGRYQFIGLPSGRYRVVAELSGFASMSTKVVVTQTHGMELEVALRSPSVSESITVTAEAPGIWSSVQEVTPQRAVVAPLPVAAPQPGPTMVPSIATSVAEPSSHDPQYAAFEDHGFLDVATQSVTTFAIDVDRASYANIRRFLNDGLLPPGDAVRVEEMLNYFSWSYPQPSNDDPFSITTEVAGCPWNAGNRLLRVGIQGRNLEQWRMAPNNLVFLIDVSGSMGEPRKLPLLIQAFALLANELRAEDRVSIVVYAGAAGLVLPPTSGADRQTILASLTRLSAGGTTAGGAGIELAYQIAQDQFLPDGNNRVILATDGDFNVGVSSMSELETLIEAKRKTGVYLSVLGVGSNNLQDAKMEMLADKGNGNYSYLDSLKEAEKVFRTELTGTLVTIAKDVKIQLEFDPSTVKAYRQIGYENRSLANEDFEDDTKDAGELGAGHSVTALFELVPAAAPKGRIATVRLRYKEPRAAESKLLVAEAKDDGKSAYDASPDMQFATAIAEMGMLLRESAHKGTATWDDVFQLARVARGVDLDGTREEFVKIAEVARRLK